MNGLEIFYTLLGGLGMFFYGMQLMSDALQAVAGNTVRRIISSLTANRLLAVLVGAGVTSVIQSSSITTVMLVGLVNAGLMELTQAIGVIFGANIGTTITAWILSLNIGKYGILLIGISAFPYVFSSKDNVKNTFRVGLGIGLVFCGLLYMSQAVTPFRTMPEIMDLIARFSEANYKCYLINIGIGMIVTAIIQSSSAFSGIIIAMGTAGILNLPAAIALILGSNIGTTITAQLAAITASTDAKRVALAHTLFNVIGVLLILPFLNYFIQFLDWSIPGNANYVDPKTLTHPYLATRIAWAHTFFNIGTTIVLLPMIGYLAKLVQKIIPSKGKEDPFQRTLFISYQQNLVPATALAQVGMELLRVDDMVGDTMELALKYLIDAPNEGLETLRDVASTENSTDLIQKEITIFLGTIMKKRLTVQQSKEAQAFLRIIDEYESVADYLEKLVLDKKKLSRVREISVELKSAISNIFKEIASFNYHVRHGLNGEPLNKMAITNINRSFTALTEELLDTYLATIKDDPEDLLTAITFSDMVNSIKKIGGHYYNIYQALKRAAA